MSTTFDQLKERRLERMRKGQEAATIENLLSDPEIRIALVPLIEGDYDECMRIAAAIDVPDDSIQGAQVVDREERRQVIFRAARQVDDYTKPFFPSMEEMKKELAPHDVNHLYECYLELIRSFSPKMAALSQEDIDFLSDLFVNLPWNDLSGAQVYALSRFLSLLQPEQLTDSLPGHLLTR